MKFSILIDFAGESRCDLVYLSIRQTITRRQPREQGPKRNLGATLVPAVLLAKHDSAYGINGIIHHDAVITSVGNAIMIVGILLEDGFENIPFATSVVNIVIPCDDIPCKPAVLPPKRQP